MRPRSRSIGRSVHTRRPEMRMWMTMTAPRDDGVEAEQELVGRLFAQLPGDDPHALLRAASLPGCRYHVVDALLRDPRFAPRRVAPSPEPVWQMFARWLISLD